MVIILGAALILAILAGIASLVWSNKGGHPIDGFVLGFVFGVLGLIYTVAAKPHARRGELVFVAFVSITIIALVVAALIYGWATTSEAPTGVVFALIVASLLPLAVLTFALAPFADRAWGRW